MSNTVTVAIIQASPIFNNLAASLEKAVELIKQAAAQGAKLIAFGESWLSGYPAWLDYCPKAALWDYEPTKEVYALMRQNSLVVESKETALLARAACESKAAVVIGANERVDKGAGNGTLYNTLLTFDETGSLANHHRKLIPTFTERLVHGQGDGAGLQAVDTAAGRVGGLICWEHWMPFARQAMHDSGEQFHAALFPTVHENHLIASRHYAFEGRCFVLAAGLLMHKKDVPLEMEENLENAETQFLLRGGSCIIAPDGKVLTPAVFDEETIITAELDLNLIEKEKMTLDVSGHYQRPDIFKFAIERNTRSKFNIFE